MWWSQLADSLFPLTQPWHRYIHLSEGDLHAVLRNINMHRIASALVVLLFFPIFLCLVCHSIHPPDNHSFTLVFSQSGTQSFAHLFISLFTLLSPVFYCLPLTSSFYSYYSFYCLLSVLCCLSSLLLSICSSSLSINSSLVGWRC